MRCLALVACDCYCYSIYVYYNVFIIVVLVMILFAPKKYEGHLQHVLLLLAPIVLLLVLLLVRLLPLLLLATPRLRLILMQDKNMKLFRAPPFKKKNVYLMNI